MNRLSQVLRGRLFRSLFTLSAAEGAARLLSFAFYLVAARLLEPAGFGEVRLTIALVLMLFGPVQVLSHSIVQQLGEARGDNVRTKEVLDTGLLAAVSITCVVGSLSAIACAAGLVGRAGAVTTAVVLGGYTAFQFYYGIARGVGEFHRAASTYVGASALQLAALLLAATTVGGSVTVALVLFGLSGLIPIVVWEMKRPLFARPTWTPSVWRRVRQVGAPLVIAQLCFVIWFSADQLWAEVALPATEVGLYGAAKNLAQMFMILPAAVTGFLVAEIAQYRALERDGQALRIVAKVAVVGGLVSVALAAVVAVLREPLLVVLYGNEFRDASGALVPLAFGMAGYFVIATISSAGIGWGEPRLFAVGMATAAVSELALFVVFSPGAAGIGWCVAISVGTGLFAMAVHGRTLQVRSERGVVGVE